MGSSSSKETVVKKQKAVIVKPKEKDAWDIDELCEYRLNHIDYERKLYEAIDAYWDEIFLIGIDTANSDDNEDKNDDDDKDLYGLRNDCNLGNNDKDLTHKVIFGGINPGKKNKRKNLEYFTDQVYEDWSWTMYVNGHYGMFEKQGNYPPLYERAIFHFIQKFEEIKIENDKLFQYHDAETLAKNEVHEFLWIFIGYQYNKTYKPANNHFIGDDNEMLNFLNELSLLFKVIMIGYNYEQYQYKKIVNHYMKPCLANIDKPILEYALDIARNKGLKKKNNNNQYLKMKEVYKTIINRMEACRSYLSENGIEMKKKL